MKKLLITGASGFLGYHLLRLAIKDWEVYGLSHSNQINFDKITSVNCDITNYIELGNLIEDIEPDAIIHTAAISDANFCQQNKELSEAINVEATANLAGICSDYNIPLAFTSTDLVFDGKKGMYMEEDTVNPLNTYGEQKVKAEQEIQKLYPRGTIFRIPLLFGYPEASTGNYLRKFISQVEVGDTVSLFTDEYRSMCGAKSIAQGILQLFENSSGILHLAGNERLSRYEFGMKVANAFVLPSATIKATSQKDVKMAAPRPADVSLNSSKTKLVGYSPLTVDEELKLIAEGTYF